MSLRDEILRSLEAKAVAPSNGHGRMNVPFFGIQMAEDVVAEEERKPLSADEYFHAERKREILERVSLADQTLLDGQLLEEAAYTEQDVAQAVAWEQLQAYKRDLNITPESYAWELVWDHGS